MFLSKYKSKGVYTVIAIFFSFSSTVWSVQAAEIKDGTIVLSDKNDSNSCTIPFVTGTYNLLENGAGHGCENDTLSMIGLNNVPSATTVFLSDTPDCNKKDGQNYWVEFKTIKQPTNVKGLLISKFFDKSNGDVIAPGIRRVDAYHRNDDSFDGKLSCVKITRSAIP